MRNKLPNCQIAKLPNCQKGMTIVEMAVGIGLTVVLGGALVSMGVLAINASNSARMKARALRYAEEAVEVIRRTRDDLSTASLEQMYTEFVGKSCCLVDSSLSAGCGPETKENFIRTITLTDASGGANDKIKVEVEVSWKERGRDKSVKLETFLTAWTD